MDRSKFDELQAISAKKAESSQLADLPRPEDGNHTGMQFGFDVVEVQRVGLTPGDVLMVTVKNDDLTQESVDMLRNQLQIVFPNNKVFVFAMKTVDDVQLSIVSQSENPVASCGPVGYCSDCDCGKKEQATETDEPA
jgi:hypothetical protein